jgi:glycerol-3-phosphate acyltransferase PlsX
MEKIVVDLMGADNKPEVLIEGAIKAANENKDVYLYLCGPKTDLDKYLGEFKNGNAEIVDCTEQITNYDKPVKAFKTKPNSSLVKGLNLAKDTDDIKAFVSCGSTGAVLVSSVFILGRIGKVRPALSPILGGTHEFCIVDCGANVDTRVDELLDFAKMGKAYMEASGVSNPKIALLSNGSEPGKGNDLVKEAYAALSNMEGYDFIGNVEGKNILSSDADVIVCDGFAGNIALKTIEGTAIQIVKGLIEYGKKNNCMDVIGKAVGDIMNKFDYNTKGGAVMLGVNKLVIKGHGAAVGETIYSIINQAYKLSTNKLIDKIKDNLNG